ncbi:type II toxin-antitoxin system RelE/ParE family toxin [Jiella pacifica]|uniref:Type II toxin-antitoxin system RelE/ParE family toxin n=1 Tax=Jiella pacifica TaxID=2696469 RepID=A0A6N9T241_9HYPH|nr:type II toxin-antitoxin system RelE/ParE family toxin [Jiella pacifica]NDW04245.1 type II toxin-antitoxin system RelE/ParE family toxin [Jiella pacifica]
MRRVDVIYRDEARLDLEQIYDAIFEISRSHDVAEGFVERVRARCEKIGDAPLGGRRRDDLRPCLRSVPFEKSPLILYRVAEAVEIVNIFLRGRNYEALFHDPGYPASR